MRTLVFLAILNCGSLCCLAMEPSVRTPMRSNKKEPPPIKVNAACTKQFINFDGQQVLDADGTLILGQWGEYAYNKIRQPEYDALRDDSLMRRISSYSRSRKDICPAWNSKMDDERKNFVFIWAATALAHVESGCDPNQRTPAGNTVNLGLFMVEEDPFLRRRSERAAECLPTIVNGRVVRDVNLKDAKQNMNCMIGDFHKRLTNGLPQQWGPLHLRNAANQHFLQLVHQFPLCRPDSGFVKAEVPGRNDLSD